MLPNPSFPADLATFTEEILNRKFSFLYIGLHSLSWHEWVESFCFYEVCWRRNCKKNFAECEECSNSEFFWFVFSRIWTEYKIYFLDLRIQSKCKKIKTKKNSGFGHVSCNFYRLIYYAYIREMYYMHIAKIRRILVSRIFGILDNIVRTKRCAGLPNWS